METGTAHHVAQPGSGRRGPDGTLLRPCARAITPGTRCWTAWWPRAPCVLLSEEGLRSTATVPPPAKTAQGRPKAPKAGTLLEDV